jgi:PAS domain S-box-containing protein
MSDIENYLGQPSLNSNGKDWELDLNNDIKLNLDNICDLILTIFEAQGCRIFGTFPQSSILIAQRGQMLGFVEHESDKNPTGDQGTFHLVSPISLPSGLPFGYIEFYRQTHQSLTDKEQSILQVIKRDISNHLLQNRHIFEAAKSVELQQLISLHNKDWIFVKDVDFKIVYANAAFIALYPKDKQDKIIGYTTIEEYEEKEADIFLKHDKLAFEHGESIITEDLHMPDGSRMIVETIKSRFTDETGHVYILGICRDITEKEGLIRQLKKANNDLDDFTSIASHDLKAPLNAIRRLLEWIEEDCRDILPEESLDNLLLVVSRANRMHSLLEDLLSFAKIGREDITVVEMSMLKLFEDISPLLDLPKEFALNVQDVNLVVPSIPFKTVMLNIVGNAIKHNDKPDGVINVTMKTNRHYYIISVADNGPGIEPRYFDRVFQLFQTLKSRDEVEGTGLGLSVVIKHLNQFSGKVEIESDGKLGTTFNIFWPKQKV